MRRVKHIIWDWNGTILDDTEVCIDIVNAMLRKRNIPEITAEYYAQVFDFPVADYYKKIGMRNESIDEIAKDFISMYEKKKYECIIREGFLETIEKLNQYQIKHSVLSAYADVYLKEIIEYFKLTKYFEIVCGQNNIFAGSKIENGKRLIEKLNVPKNTCIFIGDTTHDVETADAMGIECYLIPSGHNSLERMKNKTDKILESLLDILQITT